MNPFSIVTAVLKENAHRPSKTWREQLRAQLGPNGEALHVILADLAAGKAWMATLPNGQYSAPVLPSSDVRLRAAMFLHEALYGRAVPQTEIQKAELEAKEFESIRALNDEQLETEALRIIDARKTARLSAGPVQDAEYVEELDIGGLAEHIWTSAEEPD